MGMAVNESRDMIIEMQIGATEGSYKSTSKDRGGVMSADTALARQDLDEGLYDIRNVPLAARPLPTGRWSKFTSGNRGGVTY